jgi:hypothetical protein
VGDVDGIGDVLLRGLKGVHESVWSFSEFKRMMRGGVSSITVGAECRSYNIFGVCSKGNANVQM